MFFKKLSAVLALFLGASLSSWGQPPADTIHAWAKQLGDPADKTSESFNFISRKLVLQHDTVHYAPIIQQLEELGESDNPYFSIRLKLLKVSASNQREHLRGSRRERSAAMQLMHQALQQAYQVNDEFLIAKVYIMFFSLAKFYNEYEFAVMYGIYSAELFEKLFGEGTFPYYQFLGEMMYRVREYNQSIKYCTKFLTVTPRDTAEYETSRMMALNTLALAYHRTGRYDSAFHFYRKAIEIAHQVKRNDWDGIISGNMGQVHYLRKQYDSAIALLEKDYRISMEYQYFDNAANSLQWAALAHAAIGNHSQALHQVWQSLHLIRQMPDEGYEQNIYKAAAQIYQANGKMDSAIFYSARYQALHDSIEKKINVSSAAIANIRIKEEQSRYKIMRLHEEKQAQLWQRNLIISAIFLLSVLSIFFINRQRARLKRRQEKLEQEKKLMEVEITAARQQMDMFTQNIIEKTNLIDKLESQVHASNSSANQQEMLAALSNHTILTEADWDNFKKLFEKVNPLFFQRLKSAAPDITVAEQRMAALTLLQLTSRQMATMQGISPDSVHKMRQRLRQRLGISNETNLEEYLKGV